MGLYPAGASQLPGWLLGKTHCGDHRCQLAVPCFFVKLTVHIPLDAPGRKFQGFVDLLQDSLQLLLLSDLGLGDFSNVQLLTLKFLWGDKGQDNSCYFWPQATHTLMHVYPHIDSLNKYTLNTYSVGDTALRSLSDDATGVPVL